MATDFEECLAFTVDREKGTGTIKGDKGGLTKDGITQKTYNLYRESLGQPAQSVRFCTKAERDDIYYRWYWLKAGCADLPLYLALCVFDTAVHSGPEAAVKMLQETVGAEPDGIIGAETLHCMSLLIPKDIIEDFLSIRQRLLVRLSAPGTPLGLKVRKGFMNRIALLRERALKELA